MAKNDFVALIVAADEPALFFSSIEAAEAWIEPTDVADGVYRAAYGPSGERYEVRTDNGRVVIAPADAHTAPEELRALLHRYFEASGTAVAQTDELDDLLSRCRPTYS